MGLFGNKSTPKNNVGPGHPHYVRKEPLADSTLEELAENLARIRLIIPANHIGKWQDEEDILNNVAIAFSTNDYHEFEGRANYLLSILRQKLNL